MRITQMDIISERAVSAKIKLNKRPEGGKITRLVQEG
jgi:hypothetical protein